MYVIQVLEVIITLASFGTADEPPPVPIYTPGPMVEPAIKTCEQFHFAHAGESCWSIIDAIGLSMEEFRRINPSVTNGPDCPIQADFWYCVKAKATGEQGSQLKRPNRGQKGHLPDLSKGAPLPKESDKNKDEDEDKDKDKDKDKDQDKGKKTSKQPPPITPGPPVPTTVCAFGDCWWGFLQASTRGQKVLDEASHACTMLYNRECKDHTTMGFPKEVEKGCKNCEELSSGCPCFTGGLYHTWTDQLWFPSKLHRDVFGRY